MTIEMLADLGAGLFVAIWFVALMKMAFIK